MHAESSDRRRFILLTAAAATASQFHRVSRAQAQPQAGGKGALESFKKL
jgi:hypothetical protein